MFPLQSSDGYNTGSGGWDRQMVTEVAIEPQPQVTTTTTTKQCAAIRPQLIDTSALLRHLNWVQNQHTNAQVCGIVLLVNFVWFCFFFLCVSKSHTTMGPTV